MLYNKSIKNRRIVSAMVAALLILMIILTNICLTGETVFAADIVLQGEGTESSPYIINTAEELVFLAERINVSDWDYNLAYYRLDSDIDLSVYNADNKAFNNGKGWIPIGYRYGFFGTFDGNGKTVSNLYINDENLDNAGLFGIVKGGKVKNLGVVNVDISAKDDVGGVAGDLSGCYGESEFYYGAAYVAEESIEDNEEDSQLPLSTSYPLETPLPLPTPYPLIPAPGPEHDFASISNCFVTGNIRGDGAIGGITGSQSYGGVSRSYTDVSVSGTGIIGGICGYAYVTGVSNCYSKGSVVCNAGSCGGIVGYYYYGHGAISGCYTECIITGEEYVGGIAGYSYSIMGDTIENNVVLSPQISGNSYVGRIVGEKTGEYNSNYGLDSCEVLVNSNKKELIKGRYTEDGADIAVSDVITESFWTNDENWEKFYELDTEVWSISDGKLPILLNVGGTQNGELNLYTANVTDIKLSDDNKNVIVSYDIANNDKAILITAIYIDDLLYDVEMNSILNSGKVGIPIPENMTSVKAMIWKDMNSNSPLGIPKEMKND